MQKPLTESNLRQLFQKGSIIISVKIAQERFNEYVSTVRGTVDVDPRTSYEFIRPTLGINMSQIQNILHQQLKVKKLWCRWFKNSHCY